jgi:formylglycine-generating enzyme required for sulfatase activity
MLVRSQFFIVVVGVLLVLRSPAVAGALVQETSAEFITATDLNGDGLEDVLLADKRTGRLRPGYQRAEGPLQWVDWREAGVRDLTGMSVGRVLRPEVNGVALVSKDGNQIALLELSSPTTPSAPVDVPFLLLGPATVVAVDLGGEANTPLDDLVIGSVYNSPDENMLSLFRNRGDTAESITDLALPGTPRRGNPVSLKDGSDAVMALLLDTPGAGTTLRVQSFATGTPVDIASVEGLPSGVEYTVAHGSGPGIADFLFHVPGTAELVHRALQQTATDKFTFGPERKYTLDAAIVRVSPLTHADQTSLFVVHGDGARAGVYRFDGTGAPTPIQQLTAPSNYVFTAAVGVPEGFMALACPTNGGSSTRYQLFAWEDGRCKEGIYGSLPSLADNDNLTIPGIHERIVATGTAASAAEMKPYTNSIPGTRVSYVMLPIPGGEFLMGSPEDEPGHKPDEAPQHPVRVTPFWMGQCEVTWNEFELFMYKDEEKKMRQLHPTDEAGDKLADAVTHPSKPYTDMTFGMGRDNYPAIAMTQHAANKYCQWLSAKTGHFYRLPTEAEWEFACRAGTTTPWFFGDDESQLDQYAWYENNSDFKYQKVGRKKPNPWGLHDIYGNVVEWVLDQYDPDFFRLNAARGVVVNPLNKATKPYPHVVRGGSWDDPLAACRSAARRGSTPAWKLQDPQLPKSTWYFTDADFVGFRLVRPLETPDATALRAYWNSGVERD